MQKTWYSHTLEYGDQLIRKHPVHWNPTRPCVLGPPARPAALPSLLPGFPSRLDLQTLKRPGRGACCPPSVPWHPGIRSVCAPDTQVYVSSPGPFAGLQTRICPSFSNWVSNRHLRTDVHARAPNPPPPRVGPSYFSQWQLRPSMTSPKPLITVIPLSAPQPADPHGQTAPPPSWHISPGRLPGAVMVISWRSSPPPLLGLCTCSYRGSLNAASEVTVRNWASPAPTPSKAQFF